MRGLLIAGTVVEIVLVLAVLVVYLVRIARSLRGSAALLAKVSFGVRAIESQCAPIGPSVTQINDRLEDVASELSLLAGMASEAVGRGRRENGAPGG